MDGFWRSVNLTGNQTPGRRASPSGSFWRSVNLTGNQTPRRLRALQAAFWRSVNLTGNQTDLAPAAAVLRFGAVSI